MIDEVVGFIYTINNVDEYGNVIRSTNRKLLRVFIVNYIFSDFYLKSVFCSLINGIILPFYYSINRVLFGRRAGDRLLAL